MFEMKCVTGAIVTSRDWKQDDGTVRHMKQLLYMGGSLYLPDDCEVPDGAFKGTLIVNILSSGKVKVDSVKV